MDKLWAPWRINYVRNMKQRGCVFCHANRPKAKDYVVFKTTQTLAMLNIFPYNNGHMLVSPKRHIARLEQLNEAEALDLFRAIAKAQKLLTKVLKPHGFNIGMNLSRAAGAGITGHLHIHIVPRWIGDTNFMPVLSNTRVISQSLAELYKQCINAQTKSN